MGRLAVPRLMAGVLRNVVAIACLCSPVPALSETPATVTQFSIPTPNSRPQNITAGPDGALWFVERNAHQIARIDPVSHVVTEFPLAAGSIPVAIAPGADGALWFTDIAGPGSIGRIDPVSHAIVEFPISTIPPGFPFPLPGAAPFSITAGPDGAMWFTDAGPGLGPIGRIDVVSHVITGANANPVIGPGKIVAGADGGLWFNEPQTFLNDLFRIDPASRTVTIFPTKSFQVLSLIPGSDGAIWFGETSQSNGVNQVARLDLATHEITEFAVSSVVGGLAAGPDGAVWFSLPLASKIARIDPVSHIITEIDVQNPADSMVAGPDGALWFTNSTTNSIGRITVPTATLGVFVSGSGTGSVTSLPSAIACGNGQGDCVGNLPLGKEVTLTAVAVPGSTFTGWSGGGGCVGIEPCTLALADDTAVAANFVTDTTSDVTLTAAILPTSRSVQVGKTATVFPTIVNASGDTTATNCTLQPATALPAAFAFQTTDPLSNTAIGATSTPVDIPPGKSQSFVVALTPAVAFSATELAFDFRCANATAAATLSGLDTLLLSASGSPVPDIVALAATSSNDGIVDVPSPMGAAFNGGTGAFAVAAVNIGAAGVITALADTGAASVPLRLMLCQTDSASGACLQPPGASVPLMIGANDTPTFAIFVTATETLPFSPAVNRVFVRFTDASGTVRGATSVAVRTQ